MTKGKGVYKLGCTPPIGSLIKPFLPPPSLFLFFPEQCSTLLSFQPSILQHKFHPLVPLAMSSISKILLLALALSGAQAAPFDTSARAVQHPKRIAQVIADSTQKWEAACLAAGGAQQCNPQSQASFMTLLAAAGACDQQNQGDNMIDLAKQLNNDPQMIQLTQIFVQQPRNTPNSVSVPYCQQAPKNQELAGLFQCQFAGADPQTFVGGVAVGGPGTIPFGQSSALNPPGSCPANPNGPVPDGQQLITITQNPGTPGSGANTPSSGSPNTPANGTTPSSSTTPLAPSPTPGSTSQTRDFKLQNGQDAQKLNAQFATLTADSACTAGQNACVEGAFSQCVNGKFSSTPCSSPLSCFALPLVNSPGTSITCTTEADATTRIANTGAQGGITG